MIDLPTLFSANCGVEMSKDIPTRLYRTVLYDLGIRYPQWETKLIAYVDKIAEGIPNFDKSSERGNITKAMLKHTLTWSSFITMFKILNCEEVALDLRMTWDKSPFHNHAKWGNEEFTKKCAFKTDLLSSDAENFLTHVVTNVLAIQNIDARKWYDLVSLSIEESKSLYHGSNAASLSSRKGNTARIVGKEQVTTWKNFVSVAEALRPTNIRMKITLRWPKEITTMHSLTFVVGSAIH